MEDKKLVGSSAVIRFPEVELVAVPARIDTGARLSSIWGHAQEENGQLVVTFFGQGSPLYTGKKHIFRGHEYEQVAVASSMGHIQTRYKIKLLVVLKGKKIRAAFSIADRSTQVYPVLLGRNVLRGKFVVDVKKGQSLRQDERSRIEELQSHVPKNSKKELES